MKSLDGIIRTMIKYRGKPSSEPLSKAEALLISYAYFTGLREKGLKRRKEGQEMKTDSYRDGYKRGNVSVSFLALLNEILAAVLIWTAAALSVIVFGMQKLNEWINQIGGGR